MLRSEEVVKCSTFDRGLYTAIRRLEADQEERVRWRNLVINVLDAPLVKETW